MGNILYRQKPTPKHFMNNSLFTANTNFFDYLIPFSKRHLIDQIKSGESKRLRFVAYSEESLERYLILLKENRCTMLYGQDQDELSKIGIRTHRQMYQAFLQQFVARIFYVDTSFTKNELDSLQARGKAEELCKNIQLILKGDLDQSSLQQSGSVNNPFEVAQQETKANQESLCANCYEQVESQPLITQRLIMVAMRPSALIQQFRFLNLRCESRIRGFVERAKAFLNRSNR